MRIQLPNTVYDTNTNYHWQNASDRESLLRTFSQDDIQHRKMAQALLTANPLTTNEEIQVNMNQPGSPGKLDERQETMGIEDVLANDINYNANHLNDSHATDFSGSQAGWEATMRPYNAIW